MKYFANVEFGKASITVILLTVVVGLACQKRDKISMGRAFEICVARLDTKGVTSQSRCVRITPHPITLDTLGRTILMELQNDVYFMKSDTNKIPEINRALKGKTFWRCLYSGPGINHSGEMYVDASTGEVLYDLELGLE